MVVQISFGGGQEVARMVKIAQKYKRDEGQSIMTAEAELQMTRGSRVAHRWERHDIPQLEIQMALGTKHSLTLS